MYKDSTVKYISATLKRLNSQKITIYKIATIVGEPDKTLYKIFKSTKTKYSEERVLKMLSTINEYLDEQEGIEAVAKLESDIKLPGNADCPEIFENYDLYIKLFELGLNAKTFNPEDKLHFAIWHRTLTAYKKNLNTDSEN